MKTKDGKTWSDGTPIEAGDIVSIKGRPSSEVVLTDLLPNRPGWWGWVRGDSFRPIRLEDIRTLKGRLSDDDDTV